MSDPGRKDLTTQLAEHATPQSQKTTGEKIKESVTGAVDKAKAIVTPNSQKSATQQTADYTRSHDGKHGTHGHGSAI